MVAYSGGMRSRDQLWAYTLAYVGAPLITSQVSKNFQGISSESYQALSERYSKSYVFEPFYDRSLPTAFLRVQTLYVRIMRKAEQARLPIPPAPDRNVLHAERLVAIASRLPKTFDNLPTDVLGIVGAFFGRPTALSRVCKTFNHRDVSLASYKALRQAYEANSVLRGITRDQVIDLTKRLRCEPSHAQVVMAVNMLIVDSDRDHLAWPPAPSGIINPQWLASVSHASDICCFFETVGEDIPAIREAYGHLQQTLRLERPKQRHLITLALRISHWMIQSVDRLSSTTLRLSEAGYTTLPSLIGLFKRLEELEFHQNFITQIPDQISECRRLTDLDLGGNELEDVTPELGSCKKLRNLMLGMNRIIRFPSIQVGQWKRLQEFDLSGNLLPSFPVGIGNCPELRVLRLYNNKIEGEMPAELSGCRKLRELDISRNQITALTDVVGELIQLRKLFMHHNEVRELPAAIKKCTRLAAFNLENNPLTMSRKAIQALVPSVPEDKLKLGVRRTHSLAGQGGSEPQDAIMSVEGAGSSSSSTGSSSGSKHTRIETDEKSS